MVNAGDQIRLSSTKGPDREGVVTAVAGSLVMVRWASGTETSVIPAPGTLTVVVGVEDALGATVQKAEPESAEAEKTAADKRAEPDKNAKKKEKKKKKKKKKRKH